MESNLQISKTENIILWIVRMIVGVLFILSGFSKLIDPHGLEYKMFEFCEVLSKDFFGGMWSFFAAHALALSVTMIAFEIIAGFALLIGYRFRLFSFLLLLLTLFFTFLTAYALFRVDASGNTVIKECGCFGNCVKLTNNETFWKDVILTILIIYIFYRQKFISSVFGNGAIGTILMVIVAIAAFVSQMWVLKHGALVDCLPYKLGSNLPEKMKKQPAFCKDDEVEFKFIYRKGTEEKILGMAELGQIDSTWTFVDRKDVVVKKGNCNVEIKDFRLIGYDGTDLTQEILHNPNTIVMYIAKNIGKADNENIEKLKLITDKCIANGVKVYGCSAGNQEQTDAFKTKHQLSFSFHTLDEILCKTIIRTNSGLLLLKNGTVTYKCASPDYPTFEQMPINK